MLKDNLKLLLVIGLLIILTGCEDILEEDISKDFVQTINPKLNDTILGNSVNFTWIMVEGADEYLIRVQDERGIYYMDSLVMGNNFLVPLEPGNYQWRIRAENSAYQSEFSESINFTVLASDDLAYNQVFLDIPVNGYYTNQTEVVFAWQSNEFADKYRFQLQMLNGSQQVLIDQNDITETSYSPESLVFENDGKYKWRVQAINNFSQTRFSERIFYIDRQSPKTPTLSQPDNQFQSIYKAIDFSWKRISEEGEVSKISYGFELSDDNSFSNIISNQTLQDTTLTYTFDDYGTFYWRVKSIDRAGNSSQYSNIRSLILQ